MASEGSDTLGSYAGAVEVNCTPFVRQYGILTNKWGAVQRRQSPVFRLNTPTLFRRSVVPSEMADGQERKPRRVDQGGEQKGREVQLHLRVVGPHPDAQQRIGEGVAKALAGDHQPHDTANQSEGHRRGESPENQAEKELHRDTPPSAPHRSHSDSSGGIGPERPTSFPLTTKRTPIQT